MNPKDNKIAQLTIPLSPYLHNTRRIRPQDSLDLRNMVQEILKSTVTTVSICGKPWSIVSVLSSYSPDIHVMVIETSDDRYLPGPERVPENEGDQLMMLWAEILDFIARRKDNDSIHIGYNWSQRAWGAEEEKTGLQSIPTKWHAMLWGWPKIDKKCWASEHIQLVDAESLTRIEKRLLGDNKYAIPFAELIKARLEKAFRQYDIINEILNPGSWKIDGRGICATFNWKIQDMLREAANFFSKILKPLASELERIMRELTEDMTTLKCARIDKILYKTEKGPLGETDLQMLRAAPRMRTYSRISKAAQKRGYSKSFIEAIEEPVRARCEQTGDRSKWWRKGFGYALVFNSRLKEDITELRIMPGVFVGPGGVVEAQGVILRRPEDEQMPMNKIEEKSHALWELAEIIKKKFPK